MLRTFAIAFGTILALLIVEDVATSLAFPEHICSENAEKNMVPKNAAALLRVSLTELSMRLSIGSIGAMTL